MSDNQFISGPANWVQQCELWSDHVDALERHLSARRWALTAVTVLLIAYPIARIAAPMVFHDMVPDMVRNVINLI